MASHTMWFAPCAVRRLVCVRLTDHMTLRKYRGVIKALYLKVLMQTIFVAEFHRENVSITRKTAN